MPDMMRGAVYTDTQGADFSVFVDQIVVIIYSK